MNLVKRLIPVQILLVVTIFLLLPMVGCGGSSDQTTATATDVITGPADVTITTAACAAGSSYLYPPLLFYVKDKNGIAKSGVDVVFYTGSNGGSTTDPFWFTDDSYAFIRTDGVGPLQRITVTTDSSGKAEVFWATSILPNANPVVGTTAGKDIKGADFVRATSGLVAFVFTVDWTVTGCSP
jgi:hypothetical protein